LESRTVGRAARQRRGAHGKRHPYLPLSRSHRVVGWLAGCPLRQRQRPLQSPPLWALAFACRGALVRVQRGELPPGFASYGRLILDSELRGAAGVGASELALLARGGSLREATRRRGDGEECGVCLALPRLSWLVGWPPARYRPSPTDKSWFSDAPPRLDSVPPIPCFFPTIPRGSLP